MESGDRMSTLLLVDGHNLLFQMFYGMPSRIIGRDGRAIQGTLGFVGALLKILRIVAPTHVAILFDGEHENPRAALDAAYKANRIDYSLVPDENNPFSQLADVYAALDCMGIRHAEVTDGEPDDAVAAYVRAYGQDMRIIIASFDSDFFQLVSDNVSVLRYRGKNTTLWDSNVVWDKYGVEPSQYADFKALVGDASDNIRGAEGIGPKTAAWLLRKFGTLEEALSRAEEINRPAIRRSVQVNAERLIQNTMLIRLDGNAELPFPLEELMYQGCTMKISEVLVKIELR